MTWFWLIVAFQFKHFIADGILQGKYHLGKFKQDWTYFWPLANHCAIHALFTGLLLLAVGRLDLWYLGWFDFISHFVMDRVKASEKGLGRWKIMSGAEYRFNEMSLIFAPLEEKEQYYAKRLSNRLGWLAILFDQMWHHISDAVIVLWIVLK
jgi:hypothetical protein